MEGRAVRAECEEEFAAIARNRKFWTQHISWLKQHGVQPTKDDVDWVNKHIEGLDESRQRLEDYIVKIEQRQKASRS
jgi:hypothetical protein